MTRTIFADFRRASAGGIGTTIAATPEPEGGEE